MTTINKFNNKFNNKFKDIKYYHRSMSLLKDLYYEEYGKEEYMGWIVNDLGRYMNEFQSMGEVFVDKFYTIMRRLSFLKDKNELDIERFYKSLCNSPVENEINLCWGLLNQIERNEMIKWFYEDADLKEFE